VPSASNGRIQNVPMAPLPVADTLKITSKACPHGAAPSAATMDAAAGPAVAGVDKQAYPGQSTDCATEIPLAKARK
jgi:hypothetical protein